METVIQQSIIYSKKFRLNSPLPERGGRGEVLEKNDLCNQHNNSITTSLKIKINNKYMKTFTTDDLVRFVYNETTADESSAIKKAILENLDLAKTYQGMLTAKEELEQGKLNPSDSSIEIIMQYSRSTVKSTSHS